MGKPLPKVAGGGPFIISNPADLHSGVSLTRLLYLSQRNTIRGLIERHNSSCLKHCLY